MNHAVQFVNWYNWFIENKRLQEWVIYELLPKGLTTPPPVKPNLVP